MAHLKHGSNHISPHAGTPLMVAAADNIKAKCLSLAPAALKEPSLPPQMASTVLYLLNMPQWMTDRP